MYIFIQRVAYDLCGQKVTTRLAEIVLSPMCAKILDVKHRDISQNIRHFFPSPLFICSTVHLFSQNWSESMLMLKACLIGRQHIEFSLLDQDIAHGFDVFVPIIWRVRCLVSTRIGVISVTSCTKTDSGITSGAGILLVTKNADSCSGGAPFATHNIEPFLVTVGL